MRAALAARLPRLSGNTDTTHIKSILAKLGLPDRVHVVIWGFEHGLAPRDGLHERNSFTRE